jgi:hypothetical protein
VWATAEQLQRVYEKGSRPTGIRSTAGIMAVSVLNNTEDGRPGDKDSRCVASGRAMLAKQIMAKMREGNMSLSASARFNKPVCGARSCAAI